MIRMNAPPPSLAQAAHSLLYRALLLAVGLPGPVDDVGANGLDVRLAQQVGEVLHSALRQQTLEHEPIKERSLSQRDGSEVWCHADPKYMAAGAFLNEQDFAAAYPRIGGGLGRGLGEHRGLASWGSRNRAAAQLKRDDAIHVFILCRRAAWRD